MYGLLDGLVIARGPSIVCLTEFARKIPRFRRHEFATFGGIFVGTIWYLGSKSFGQYSYI